MGVLSSFKRRYLVKRTIEAPPTILLWWGSYGYSGGPTVGDLMAVENLSRRLTTAGCEHAIVSHPELGLAGHFAVEDICAIKPVERLVFVCGPLTDKGMLRDVLAIQAGAKKIAAGVSILANHAAMTRRFDRVIARDGAPQSYFDLAIGSVTAPAPTISLDAIGVCLRGKQGEYGGRRRGLADEAGRLIDRTIAGTGSKTATLNTLLSPRNRADDILAAFASVDAVITTRMHGALLALAAGKPVIALDQIPGGAKVTSVVARTGWPLVGNVAEMDEAALRRAFDHLASAGTDVAAAQQRMLALADEALAAACDAVTSA